MTEAASDPVAALVREFDFGRYAATLFAPAEARPHLLALYAFDIELARVRDLVSEPMVGELRLQWWRDALAEPERADAAAHPVAHALEKAAAFGRLPREALVALVDARVDDLYDDPVPSVAELEGRLGATSSAALRLASLIAAGGSDPGGAASAGYGGVARGLVQLLRRLPRDAARGKLLLPVDRMAALGLRREDVLDAKPTRQLAALAAELRALARKRLAEARLSFRDLDPAAAAAFLPLALLEPELAALDKARSPLEEPPARAHWRTLLRLWRASRRPPPF
ncbi:phytoene/squalene synthase family protein [Hansschlegelia plantiphila]|uniref:Phytoene synthase n=1 Tax=Hansschlegelia plantiphila TaxID=374655 RepID=A0A9W6IZI5_9HYPH|nr:squalene/phytoene synthase family protein [Hansschlegelia plantiphila]GLK67537.1 phytoene synthase [Hansschlegelia plantiphila]